MSNWDTAPMDRRQALMFCPTLDAMIPQDHPVRLFDEILSGFDWGSWEARYPGRVGRPAIHPKVMASVILYGLSAGLRSSRRLEEACLVRMDFLWLASGRDIDHSTLCHFRKEFGGELKEVFRQTGQLAISLGLMRLNQIGLDGTRARACSSRHETATAKTLAERLAVLNEQIEAAFAEAEAADRKEAELFGDQRPTKLPRGLADLKRRQELLRKAMEKARELNRKRGLTAEGAPPGKASEPPAGPEEPESPETKKEKVRPAKVPVADPESAVMPNKEGGHAPNYMPMLGMDGARGYVAYTDVDNRPVEGQRTAGIVEAIEETFGEKPGQVLADGAYGDGEQLSQLEARGVEAYVPVETAAGRDPENPARRADPAQPVPAEAWDKLPRSTKGKKHATLDRSAFVYVQAEDCFYCPMGRKLPFKDTQKRKREAGHEVTVKRYECVGCEDCPLSAACRDGATPRRIQVDEYEPVRQRVQDRMATAEGQATYNRRCWICETPFGFIKSWMHFRQFLLRGLEKVKTEWLWVCTAYNLRKLVGDVGRMRVQFADMLA